MEIPIYILGIYDIELQHGEFQNIEPFPIPSK